MSIFAILKGQITILIKQLIAGGLLALFVFIHVVKFFHHHKETGFSSNNLLVNKTTVQSGFHCAVCDYHFIQDADAGTTFPVVPPAIIYRSATGFYILPFTTSIGLLSGNRGPPVFI